MAQELFSWKLPSWFKEPREKNSRKNRERSLGRPLPKWALQLGATVLPAGGARAPAGPGTGAVGTGAGTPRTRTRAGVETHAHARWSRTVRVLKSSAVCTSSNLATGKN